ncbi:YitT family protein [Sporosarcina globispora]|uniref:YitT family protein n=1 Tax=Sporosarcina globispora TaxID=1459 RepID=UPI000B2B0B74|nr:YitT family protein [Sporosarcina globispora]
MLQANHILLYKNLTKIDNNTPSGNPSNFHLADLSIALSSAVLFGPQVGMYAFFGVIINGFVIDYALQQFNSNKEIVIISSHSDEIKTYIVHELGKGATIHTATGTFTSDKKEVITTIPGEKRFYKAEKLYYPD